MTKTAVKEKESTTQSKNLMFIQKVKVNNDNTATIVYKTSNDLSAQEVNFTGKDQITEDFAKAFLYPYQYLLIIYLIVYPAYFQ